MSIIPLLTLLPWEEHWPACACCPDDPPCPSQPVPGSSSSAASDAGVPWLGSLHTRDLLETDSRICKLCGPRLRVPSLIRRW